MSLFPRFTPIPQATYKSTLRLIFGLLPPEEQTLRGMTGQGRV
jgi:hypothetical protein